MSEIAGPSPPEARSSPTGVAMGELIFRIRGGDYHGRIVRIRASKCTVGAAADCTLRLAGPGLRPLHCIILQGEAGASVRRWSPDTQLNGRAFSDALLMVGDRLQIGPVELEAIDEAEVAGRARSAASSGDAPNPSGPLPVADLAGEIVQHIRRDLEKDKDVRKRKVQRKRLQQARERMKRLEAELQKSSQVAKRLELEVSRLHSESKIAQHERLHAESQLSQVQAQMQRLAAEGTAGNEAAEQWRRQADAAKAAVEQQTSQWHAERATLRQSVEALQTELAKAKADFHERLADWNGERSRLTQALQTATIATPDAAAGQDPAALLATLERERAEWERERKGLQKSLDDKLHREHRLEIALSELRKSIDQEHLAASDERQQLEQQRSQLEARAQELDRYQAWCDEVAQKVRQEAGNPNVTLAFADGNPLGDDTRRQLEDAQRQLDDAQRESERLRTELSEVSQQLEAVRDSHLNLLAQRGELESQLESHAQQLQARSADLSAQEQRLAGLQHEIRELAECRSERDALRARLDQCEQQLQSASAQADSQQQLAARSHELAAAQAELESLLSAKSAELTALRSQMEQQIAARSAQLADLQTDLQQQLEAKSRELAGAQTELEQQLVVWSRELSEAQGENQRLQEEIRQKDENQILCEQNFAKKIECLEKLARNLEDELRTATANSDVVERLEAENRRLEQQSTAAQEQWNSQRQILEEQALSAHQQLQELEEQISSLRDALSSMRAQVVERDNLLSQLREEVRQQWAAWQTEREQLQQQIEAHGDSPTEPTPEQFASPGPTEVCETQPAPSAAWTFDEARTASDAEPMLPNQLLSSPFEEQQPCHDAANELETSRNDRDDYHSMPVVGIESAGPESLEDSAEPTASSPELPDVSPDPPVKVSDVLARLGAGGAWIDAAEAGAEAPATLLPVEDGCPQTRQDELVPPPLEVNVANAPSIFSVASQAGEPGPSPMGPEGEESIEAYMARLLKRVRGDAIPAAAVMPPEPAPVAAPGSKVSMPEVQPAAAEPKGEYAPRAAAPELQTDMAAMRELAVHSARQAINQSTQRKYRHAALIQTLGAFVSWSVAVGLFAWGWDTGNRLAWGGCAVSLVAGLCLTVRRLKMLIPQRALTAK